MQRRHPPLGSWSLGTKLAPLSYPQESGTPSRQGRNRRFWYSRVSIGNSNPSDGACVTAQEEKGDVASRGHQVDEHGHPDGTQGRQAELLHQEAAQEDAQTGTGNRGHPWRKAEDAAMSRGSRASQGGPILLTLQGTTSPGPRGTIRGLIPAPKELTESWAYMHTGV